MIYSVQNIYYFTGVKLSTGILLILNDIKYLLVDSRYYELAKNKAVDCNVVKANDFYKEYMTLFDKHKIKRILVEGNIMSVCYYNELEKNMPKIKVNPFELDDILKDLRKIKSPLEIQKIKNAQKLTERAFEHVLALIKPGIRELDIALEIEIFIKRNGGSLAFDTIAVSGKNSAMPHGVPTEKPIEPGDFLTLDFGARLDGYCSDMTRTLGIKTLSDKQIKVYNTVLEAQEKALEKIKPGQVCKKIDDAARNFINKTEFSEKFEHGLGHGVGIQVHEEPNFNVSCEELLYPGMVLTVEPGIYLEGEFGVRIEDMVIITQTGYENITIVPKELLIL